MTRRFVVKRDEPTIASVLARSGESTAAVREGRVFVARRRVMDAAEPVREGDEVVVEPVQQVRVTSAVIAEWRGLYAVLKPPGLPTEPDRQGAASVVRQIEGALGLATGALHAVTRLDAPVSGLVVLARGPEATRLAAQLKGEGRLRRRYIGIASQKVVPESGSWDAPIGRGPGGQRRANGTESRDARTLFATVATVAAIGGASGKESAERGPAVLVLEPVTGRTHQLRAHAAAAGAPLLGDGSHGGPRRVVQRDGQVSSVERVALHAARVTVAAAATTGKGLGSESRAATLWTVSAPHPPDLLSLWATVGGDAAAFDAALAWPELDAS